MNPNPEKVAEEYGWAAGTTHSELLAAGKQMGFIGIFLYLSFFLILILSGIRVMFAAKAWPDVSNMGWTFMLLAPVLLIGGYFGVNPWNIYLMIMAASASALWMAWKNYQAGTPLFPRGHSALVN